MRDAASRGEEPDISHHPAFALWAIDTGQPGRIPDFLMALLEEQA